MCEEEELHCFVVGTVVDEIGKATPTNGRILIFEPAKDGQFHLSAALDAKGCVWDVAAIEGKLAAAINSRVGETECFSKSIKLLISFRRRSSFSRLGTERHQENLGR